MNRRTLLTSLALGSGAALIGGVAIDRRPARAEDERPVTSAPGDFPPLDITIEKWREILPADRFRILFEEGTERAFSSPLDKLYEPGTYICAACQLPLFESDDKFDSGTGWPSFTRPIEGRMGTRRDFRLILPRTEYHCIRCGGHQGHVFEDGPPPTGQRWCNNGLALEFIPQDEKLPALRISA